jgi:hypothetical protein
MIVYGWMSYSSIGMDSFDAVGRWCGVGPAAEMHEFVHRSIKI